MGADADPDVDAIDDDDADADVRKVDGKSTTTTQSSLTLTSEQTAVKISSPRSSKRKRIDPEHPRRENPRLLILQANQRQAMANAQAKAKETKNKGTNQNPSPPNRLYDDDVDSPQDVSSLSSECTGDLKKQLLSVRSQLSRMKNEKVTSDKVLLEAKAEVKMLTVKLASAEKIYNADLKVRYL